MTGQPVEILTYAHETLRDGRLITHWIAQVLDENGHVFDDRDFITASGMGEDPRRREWIASWGLPVRRSATLGALVNSIEQRPGELLYEDGTTFQLPKKYD